MLNRAPLTLGSGTPELRPDKSGLRWRSKYCSELFGHERLQAPIPCPPDRRLPAGQAGAGSLLQGRSLSRHQIASGST